MNLEQTAKKILECFNNNKENAISFIETYPDCLRGFIYLDNLDGNILTYSYQLERAFKYCDMFRDLDEEEVEEAFKITDKAFGKVTTNKIELDENLASKIADCDLDRFVYCNIRVLAFQTYYPVVESGWIFDNETDDSCSQELVEKYDLVNLFEELNETISDEMDSVFWILRDIVENL